MSTPEIERMQALNEGGDPRREPIVWRESRALGLPYAGRLLRGVRLPAEDAHVLHLGSDPAHDPEPLVAPLRDRSAGADAARRCWASSRTTTRMRPGSGSGT